MIKLGKGKIISIIVLCLICGYLVSNIIIYRKNINILYDIGFIDEPSKYTLENSETGELEAIIDIRSLAFFIKNFSIYQNTDTIIDEEFNDTFIVNAFVKGGIFSNKYYFSPEEDFNLVCEVNASFTKVIDNNKKCKNFESDLIKYKAEYNIIKKRFKMLEKKLI